MRVECDIYSHLTPFRRGYSGCNRERRTVSLTLLDIERALWGNLTLARAPDQGFAWLRPRLRRAPMAFSSLQIAPQPRHEIGCSSLCSALPFPGPSPRPSPRSSPSCLPPPLRYGFISIYVAFVRGIIQQRPTLVAPHGLAQKKGANRFGPLFFNGRRNLFVCAPFGSSADWRREDAMQSRD